MHLKNLSEYGVDISDKRTPFKPIRSSKQELFNEIERGHMNCTGLEVRLTEILGCRSDGNTCYSVSSAATMLFHGLPGGEMHGVMEEMERRGKSDSATISSAIDMGETETVGESHASRSRRLLGNPNSLC